MVMHETMDIQRLLHGDDSILGQLAFKLFFIRENKFVFSLFLYYLVCMYDITLEVGSDQGALL